jgi:hypothetical protein
MAVDIRRRETGLGGPALAWSLVARATRTDFGDRIPRLVDAKRLDHAETDPFGGHS